MKKIIVIGLLIALLIAAVLFFISSDIQLFYKIDKSALCGSGHISPALLF